MKKTNMGEGRRIARVEKEVQSVIADYIIHYLSREIDGLVTVTRVMMPGDLRSAKVYVSILQNNANDKNEEQLKLRNEEIVEFLNSRCYEIQENISAKLDMRFVPKLKFYLDETLEKVLKVEKIISELKINSNDDHND